MALGDLFRGLQSLALDTASMVSDMSSGEATPALFTLRAGLCRTCREADSKGEPLPRFVDLPSIGPRLFCGAPRWKGMERDAVADGCGCCLALKCKCAGAQCPRGRW